MAATVHLPKVGMTMEEGVLVRWIAPDGASVRPGEPLFEMETEKTSMEVEAADEGVLKQLVAAGTTLQPGAVVGCVLAAGEDTVPEEILERVRAQAAGAGVDTPPAPDAPSQPATAPADTSPPVAADEAGGRVVASPSARRLAREQGVDLATIAGSGPAGRIVDRDILEAAARTGAVAAGAPTAPAPGHEAVPYSGRRRTIGERMHQSLQAMAQLTLSGEAPMDAALEMMHGLNREWRGERVIVTLTALVVKAAGLALREHPRLNARLDGDRIVIEPAVNIGVAVDHPDGLMVPVVRSADALPLKEIAQLLGTAVERVRDGSVGVDELTGGTFAVTSLEAFAVDAFTPVINPPQAAILGIGRMRDVAMFSGDAVRRGKVTTLSLTFDHRVLDGAPAARFLTRVTELLERPYLLM